MWVLRSGGRKGLWVGGCGGVSLGLGALVFECVGVWVWGCIGMGV